MAVPSKGGLANECISLMAKQIINHVIEQHHQAQYEKQLHMLVEGIEKLESLQSIQVFHTQNQTESHYAILVDAERLDLVEKHLEKLSHMISRTYKQTEFITWNRILPNSPKPNKYKTALLAWSVAFPLILGLSYLLGILAPTMTLFLKMIIISVVMISAMTMFLLPLFSRLFHNWLNT